MENKIRKKTSLEEDDDGKGDSEISTKKGNKYGVVAIVRGLAEGRKAFVHEFSRIWKREFEAGGDRSTTRTRMTMRGQRRR